MPQLFIKKEQWEKFLQGHNEIKKIVREEKWETKEQIETNKKKLDENIEKCDEMVREQTEWLEKLAHGSFARPFYISGKVKEKSIKISTKEHEVSGMKIGDRALRLTLENRDRVHVFEWYVRDKFQEIMDSILSGSSYEFECTRKRALGETNIFQRIVRKID
jgi:hypothetical protein